ncbi:hypothetical protein GCM10009740_01710 [Terrabacter terrae]|uniref:Oxidoreductase molybdopterin-binding domain-containing protein n=1 Tax=Terrabacter terrae TaxID=318434 RepID=A0ABN2TSC6_9MICO
MAAPRRPGRRTNLALLVLLVGSFVTGWVAFGVGGPSWSRAVTVAHGILGLGILVLAPWKTVIVRRGLRTGGTHAIGVAFAVVLAVSLVAGIAHAGIGRFEVAGVNALAVHVAAAVIAVPLAAAHVIRRRQRPRRTDLSRRTLLRTAGLAAVAALAYAVQASVTSLAGFPAARRRETGSYEVGSGDPTSMPVTQWFTDGVPGVDLAAYRLEVTRADGSALRLSYGDLLAMGDAVQSAVLDCTGGWWTEQSWRGVRIDTVLGVPRQGSIAVRSVTGYTMHFPAEAAPGLLLATHVGGKPLLPGHGSPVRLVAPGRRGFWWVKWVDQIRVDARPWWLQPPFPLQ